MEAAVAGQGGGDGSDAAVVSGADGGGDKGGGASPRPASPGGPPRAEGVAASVLAEDGLFSEEVDEAPREGGSGILPLGGLGATSIAARRERLLESRYVEQDAVEEDEAGASVAGSGDPSEGGGLCQRQRQRQRQRGL